MRQFGRLEPRNRATYDYIMPARLAHSSAGGAGTRHEGCIHEPGATLLLDVKLRAPGRQSDGQAADQVQAADRGAEADPRGRGML